jgi:hypothetical protein
LREDGAVPAHARRRHAVEQVDATRHAGDQVFWKSDAYQIARSVLR